MLFTITEKCESKTRYMLYLCCKIDLMNRFLVISFLNLQETLYVVHDFYLKIHC